MALLSNPAVIGFFVFFVLLAFNVPVFVSLGGATLFTMVVLNAAPLSIMPFVISSSLDSFTLLATPLFIIAGNMLTRTGIAARLVALTEIVFGRMPGGLALTTLVAGCVLGSMSGSNIATVAALSFLIGAMANSGYPRPFAVAVVAAGCTFGVVIPPSIGFIIYGVISETSIPKLFASGVVPGLLMLLTMGGYVYVISMIKGYRPAEIERSWPIFFKALREAFWGLMAPVIILGGIYLGVFTATEAAAVAVVYTLLIDRLVYHKIKIVDLPEVFFQSGKTIGVIGMMIAMSAVFAWVLQTQGVAEILHKTMMLVSQGNSVVILLFMQLILLVCGMFLEPIAAMYLLVPLFKPTLLLIGYDLVQFGAAMTVNLSLAHLTPPVGVGLFLAAQMGGVPFSTAAKWAIPFVLCEIAVMTVTTFVPEIAMTLPSLVK
ncbi:MAG: TRAP transporter large permease [Burkholderiaceae bacterium]